jgi:catechol 2,3-dioxygenase-like lactoylglutathione lyase family enzyme
MKGFSLDHVVILVYNLERAQADYAALGFTVVEGGRHADGVTHNALVAFQDGTYLELIAFLQEPPEVHPFYRAHGEEGLVTFALLPVDIERDVKGAQRRGLVLTGPTRGGRRRPDGVHIEWQTARAVSTDLPFLCADLTDRNLRVPFGPARLHSNGTAGVAALTIVVSALNKSIERYRALLGSEPLPHGPYNNSHSSSFQVGNCVLTLVEPDGGEMGDFLVRRGEGPYAISFLAGEGRIIEEIDGSLAHGVEMEVVPQGSDILGTLL